MPSNKSKTKFAIGDRVRVVRASDETTSTRHIGHVGSIVGKIIDGQVGDTPQDPLWKVKFSRSQEEFWSEELEHA